MGIVYVVKNPNEGETRVLKTFQAEYLRDTKARELFYKEAHIWMDVTSSSEVHIGRNHVLRAYRVLKLFDQPYVELEFVNRGSLARLSRVGPSMLLDLATQFCRGMLYLTETLPGFIHCDVKPANLLLKELMGRLVVLKISDFGISQVKRNLALTLAPSDAQPLVLGDRIYMSPEQPDGIRALDPRSDIFSFGLVLIELLSLSGLRDPIRRLQYMSQVAHAIRDRHVGLPGP